MDKVLTVFFIVWAWLVMLANVVAVAGLMLGAPSFWAGVGQVQEIYSPLNLLTYGLNMVLLSPAVGAYLWRERRRGRSKDEADAAWTKAYAGQPSPADAMRAEANAERNRQQAAKRARIIADYGEYLERDAPAGAEVRDVESLPHGKEAILDAICMDIIRESDANRVEALKIGALALADFQEGVGERPLYRLGVNLPAEDPASMSEEDLKALAKKIADNPDRGRFDVFESLVQNDLVSIEAKLKAAEEFRQQMPEDKKREILG